MDSRGEESRLVLYLLLFVESFVRVVVDYSQAGVENSVVVAVHSAADYVQIVVVNFAAIAVSDVEDFVQVDSVQRMMGSVVEYVVLMVNLNFVPSEESE